MSIPTTAPNATLRKQAFQRQLGKRLQHLRLDNGFTQADIGRSIDMSRVAVGYIEQGRRAPSLGTLHELSELYGMTVSELCDVDARGDEAMRRMDGIP